MGQHARRAHAPVDGPPQGLFRRHADSKKLSAAEVSKYCTCAVEADGKLTNAQKWEIQSAINQKKSPSTLAFVQKQNKDLQTCFGPQLTGKLKSLTEEAMKAAPKK